MIQHIFKIIWNERKTNTWLLIELILVFCVLWFCCDYIWSVHTTSKGSPGFDITNTYMIRMDEKLATGDSVAKVDDYSLALTLLDRVKRHPDVEYVALGLFAGPYHGGVAISRMYVNAHVTGDAVFYPVRERKVTTDFFKVFNIPVTSGRIFNWEDPADRNSAVISSIEGGRFGSYKEEPLLPAKEVNTLSVSPTDPSVARNIIGVTGKFMDIKSGSSLNTIFLPLQRESVLLPYNQIVLRVKPEASTGFPRRFKKDMSEQLLLGPYYLASVTPIQTVKASAEKEEGLSAEMNGVYAVTSFLVVNIFMGILGAFWFRTQGRRKEIGLRMALGASKRSVQLMIIAESLILLILASVIGALICMSLGSTNFIEALGLPGVDRELWRIGYEQDMINYIVTISFLMIVTIGAILYPMKYAAKTEPATALHEQ